MRLSVVQYKIEGDRTLSQFLEKVERHIQRAVEQKVDIVLLPELITFDTWQVSQVETHSQPAPEEIAETHRIASEVSPHYLSLLAKLASKLEVDIVGGSTPRLEGENLYNTAVAFFSDGTKFMQDKIYPTHWELQVGICPGEELRAMHTKWGNAVILTCYDIEFPDLSTKLVPMRPELILVPSMTESESGLQRVRWCAQARAVEHHAFVAVSGTVGQPSETWRHFGQALIVGPREFTFTNLPTQGRAGEEMQIVQTLDFALLRESRLQTDFYPALDASNRQMTGPRLRVRE